VGLNEAQLINPQGTNKNMSPRNKIIEEWLNGGEVIEKEGKIVIRKDGEYLIVINGMIIHLVPNKLIAVKIGGRWYASYAPAWRGKAIAIARRLRPELPSMVPLPP